MNNLKRLFLIITFLIFTSSLFSQKFTISGYVTEKKSGETLIGAAIVDTISALGTVSNNYGFYSITLPKGDLKLLCTFIGYSDIE